MPPCAGAMFDDLHVHGPRETPRQAGGGDPGIPLHPPRRRRQIEREQVRAYAKAARGQEVRLGHGDEAVKADFTNSESRRGRGDPHDFPAAEDDGGGSDHRRAAQQRSREESLPRRDAPGRRPPQSGRGFRPEGDAREHRFLERLAHADLASRTGRKWKADRSSGSEGRKVPTRRTSGTSSIPLMARTARRACAISSTTSAAFASPRLTMKLACFSLICAPPRRAPFKPACSMRRPAKSPF